MRSAAIAMLVLLGSASGIRAQNEAALRNALEGKYVTIRIDMPATTA